MFKPPFMNEADALDHCVRWIEAVAERSDEISVNPMNIQRGTVIDRLHRHNEYRPPWLWSLVDMIQRAHPTIHPKGGINGDDDQVSRLIVHPTAGGKIRDLTTAVHATQKWWQPSSDTLFQARWMNLRG